MFKESDHLSLYIYNRDAQKCEKAKESWLLRRFFYDNCCFFQVFELTKIVYSSLIFYLFFQIIGMGGFLILEYFKDLKSTIILKFKVSNNTTYF
jgi:hypothetical protein